MGMLKIKQGVRIQGMRPELSVALVTAVQCFGAYDTIITSCIDGIHSPTSLHYTGCALDFRIRHLPEGVAGDITGRLAEALGADFDVLLESDHIHLEYQPGVIT